MHRSRSADPVVFAVLMVFVFVAASYAAQVVTAEQSAQNADESRPVTTLKAKTNLVQVDVVVTDHGNPVHGLDRSQFHIFEDGHEQTISAFDEHRPTSFTPAMTAAIKAEISALPPNTYTNFPLYPNTGAVNVLLLDGLNTPMNSQQDTRRQMIEYMSSIPPGTSMAVFTLSSQLRMVEGFTTNVALLAKALKGKTAASSRSVMQEPQGASAQTAVDNILANMADNSTPPSAEVVSALTQFEADLTAAQTNQRVEMTLDAMQQLARYLSGIPGRKNVIWFSGSFPITLDPDSTEHSPFVNVQMYGDAIRRTSALLTAAQVAVYPVDARGLMTSPTVDASYTPGLSGLSVDSGGRLSAANKAMNNSNVVKDSNTFMTQTMEEHGSMETIAEETGGKVFTNINNLKDAVAGAIENGSNYYTIAYAPNEEKPDGKLHSIKVNVTKSGYKLAYRGGYYSDTAKGAAAQTTEGANLITAAILDGSPPATQIILRARVLPASDPLLKNAKLASGPAGKMAATMKEPSRRYVIDLSVDPRDFTFDEIANSAHQGRLEFLLVAYDMNGNRVNYLDQTLTANLSAKQYADALASGLHARMALDLPIGRSSLRIAVQDLTAGRAGSLEVAVDAH